MQDDEGLNAGAMEAAWHAGACTLRGGSHERRNAPCQDASISCCQGNRAFMAVADGHGHMVHVRSADGARLACEAAYAVLRETHMLELSDDSVRAIAGEIILQWKEQVMADVCRRPFAQEELDELPEEARTAYAAGQNILRAYGTTLCVAIIGEGRCLILRCGDGECILLHEDGTYSCPVPENPACSGNVTVSLCEEDASGFRWYLGDAPAAVFLTTDGMTNNALNRKGLIQWYDRLLLLGVEGGADGMLRSARLALESAALKGFGDDVSLAFALNLPRVAALEKMVFERVQRCRDAQVLAEKKKRIAVLKADILWAQRAIRRRREEYEQVASDDPRMGKRLMEGIEKAESLLKESSVALARLTGQEAVGESASYKD